MRMIPDRVRHVLAAAMASVATIALAQTAQLDSLTFAHPDVRGVQAAEADRSQSCCQPRISEDGRHVLFATRASNLVAGDHNGEDDLFVRDRQTGATRMVNVRIDGRPARTSNSISAVAGSISADGRLVAFSSRQSNLAPGDVNGTDDVFLHDTVNGTTVLLVRGLGGAQPDFGARNPSISATGRYVVFESASSNLIAGPAGSATQVYLLDRDTGTIERISVTPGGQPASAGGSLPTVSDDGRFVAFLSPADDLVAGATNDGREQLFVRDRQLGLTRRLSERAGAPADDPVTHAQIAGNGTVVVFDTRAGNLVPGGTSLVRDVYLVSTAGGPISQISLAAGGVQPDRDSSRPSVSRNGRRIAFESSAVLATGGVIDMTQVYLRDLDTGSTTLVSVNNSGVNGNDAELDPQLSADGQVVAFHAFSTDLVSPDSNQVADRFVRDLAAGTTQRVNVADTAGPFPSPAFAVPGTGSTADPGESSLATRGQRQLSADARYAAFSTTSRFLGSTQITVAGSQVVRIDRSTGSVDWISRRTDGGSPLTNGSSSDAAISGNGRFVVFRSSSTVLVPGDTNNAFDVFLRDLDQNLMERVNLGPGDIQALGGQAFLPTVSDDGNVVAYSSTQNNLVTGDTNGVIDIFVRVRSPATTRRVSVSSAGLQANGASDLPVVSSNGRYVVFTSAANNLVAGDVNGLQDIFRHDLATGETVLVSVASGGAQANGNSFVSAVSADGQVVAFTSAASNLVAGDSNAATDVFVRDFTTATTTRVSVGENGAQANNASTDPSIGADGRYVGFMSSASNLVSGDGNLVLDFFRHDRDAGRTIRLSVDPEGRQARAGQTITTGTLGPDGQHSVFASNVAYFELGSGMAAFPTGRAILLSTPASEPLPEVLFANGFE